MTSLDPLFRLLVRTLSEQEPPRIHEPIAINELMDGLLPYRLVRRELGVDSAEDYETLLLRLCAGEGDFVQADPAAQTALLAELKKPLPDLAFLRVYGDTHVVLRTDPLRSAMEVHPERRYAPPGDPGLVAEAEDVPDDVFDELDAEASAEPPEAPARQDDAWVPDPVFEANASAVTPLEPEMPAVPPASLDRTQARCPFCGGLVPPRMTINFCPHCGMGQDVGTCRACGADMDVGWRYCVSCGEEAQGGVS
jgi:hypothetical protein